MPRATSTDISLTKSYIPKVSKIPGISPTIAKFYKSIENREHIMKEDIGTISPLVLLKCCIGVVPRKLYNLAYFFVKQIECARANPTANLLYGMFLTRLYRHIMEVYPHLNNGIYDIVDRVMRPLALKQTRRPRSDRGKAHNHSVSSSSRNVISST
ncbi:hypothetical protein Tco_1295463 [Tanacetum coccineum]